MRTGVVIATITLLTHALAAAAQPAIRRLDGSTLSHGQIDATVSRLMAAAEVPGVGIVIFNGGKVAYLKTYGFRDTGKKLPLTEDSVMAGASLTKAVFAYLVMQLVDDGTLDLDKPVQAYLPRPLPDYPAYRDLANDPRYQRITARMLLKPYQRLSQSSLAEPRPEAEYQLRAGVEVCVLGRGNAAFAACR